MDDGYITIKVRKSSHVLMKRAAGERKVSLTEYVDQLASQGAPDGPEYYDVSGSWVDKPERNYKNRSNDSMGHLWSNLRLLREEGHIFSITQYEEVIEVRVTMYPEVDDEQEG